MTKVLKYREYEEEVFLWLMAKHEANPAFTFSLRQNGSKGAELDYFIGTSKSNYFGTTFWTLPVSFPGSSGDCIDLIIKISNSGFSYYVEFTQTKDPHDNQNTLALQFIQLLEKDLEAQVGVKFVSGDEHKMYTIKTKPIQYKYANLKAMLLDVEKQLDNILDLVDRKLVDFKKNHPSFIMHRITLDEFNSMLERKDKRFLKYEDVNSDMNFEEVTKNEDIDEVLKTISYKAPLNQILYGPPGKGKTYNTILEAAKIITGNEKILYDDALKAFNENLANQIEFITFHQNYSYEDFIQGLRPDTENGSALTFEKKDGVFKRIADRALKNLQASKNPASAKKDFDVVFQELIQPLNDGELNELEIKMKKSSFYITEVGEKSIEFRKNIGDSNHTLSINTLRKMYDRGENDIILGGLQPYYNPILELLLVKGKSEVIEVSRKNYVIIIDEINRANISRVFGELITLIEEDKRSHGKIPMRVTLPSGDTFIVPSNLHIIGTMNTADKSISLLDIALRRRFEFVPMYPNILIEGVNSPTVLETINAEIIKRKGHDFTIGHAYFMDDKLTFEKILNNKVIPLLLEYFMNDEDEVTKILKEGGVTIGGWPLKMIP